MRCPKYGVVIVNVHPATLSHLLLFYLADVMEQPAHRSHRLSLRRHAHYQGTSSVIKVVFRGTAVARLNDVERKVQG